jgi:hypothetical protein
LNESDSLFTNEEDEYEYDGYAACTQYLGKSGITRKCVLGLAAILVSTFRPEKITMISLRQRGQKSDGVMFVVWNWLENPDITIIPDGFGTHGGEGGGGLSTVLALIQYYKIPLEHIIVTDETAFNELAEEGKLSERMFLALKRAKPYDWKYYRVESITITKQGKETFLEVDYWKFRLSSV